MKTEKKFHQFIWDFRKAIERHSHSFMTERFFGIESMLTALYREGLIVGYINRDTKELLRMEILLKMNPTGTPLVSSVKHAAKPSHRISARLRELKAQTATRTYMACIIRTARYGLISARDAVKLKTGGIFVGHIV